MDVFSNATATFETESATTEYDPVRDEDVETTEYAPEFEGVCVRAELQSASYVREVYGEWPQEVYRLFVDPLDVGEADMAGRYELGVRANDRVTLSITGGEFTLQPPNRLASGGGVPTILQLEVARIGV